MKTKNQAVKPTAKLEKKKPLVRSAPKFPSRKVTHGVPFKIISEATGAPIIEGQLIVLPDGADLTASSKPMLPGFPPPTVIHRKQMACLVREWRSLQSRGNRCFPTVTDLMGMVLQKGFASALAQTLSPTHS